MPTTQYSQLHFSPQVGFVAGILRLLSAGAPEEDLIKKNQDMEPRYRGGSYSRGRGCFVILTGHVFFIRGLCVHV